ncbi:MAG TPA: hypothetical protein VFW23_15845 [Tepidisphaeraceae bacterium]|nr:hypothetical protein [Tepidisphaeraceae bacterium]
MLVISAILCGRIALAQEAQSKTAAHDEQGLKLTIQSLAPGVSQMAFSDTRVSRLLAIDVPAGACPSAFAPPGRFRATFEGDLVLRLRDFYGIFAQGRGKLSLKINDRPVLDVSGEFPNAAEQPVRLNKGKNHLVAVYESPETGEAELRLFWVPRGQLPEPVPTVVFSHNAADNALVEGERLREGRFLLAQYRCTKCHDAGIQEVPGMQIMPELSQDAPSLSDIGSHLNVAWMAAWIDNPRAMRNRTHMPRLFISGMPGKIDQRAIDAAAYLSTLSSPVPSGLIPEPSRAKEGGRIFANLDCIACHISPDRAKPADKEADADRISFQYIKAKFKPAALVAFLLKPEAHYAWIPMPDFRLTQQEATDLAAYLLAAPAKQVDALPPGDAGRGKQLVESSGCVKCHAIEPKPAASDATKVASLEAIPSANWNRGCMAADVTQRGSAPVFELTEEQRLAIATLIGTDRKSLARECAPEFAERQIAEMRCIACHTRDGKASLLSGELDAENQELRSKHPVGGAAGQETIAPDQRAPMLTWAGQKLRPQWMEKFIAGQIPYKPRYYLLARMPGFVARGKLIADGLAEEAGCSLTYPPYPKADPGLASIGQKLAGRAPNESFSCVQCHSIANQPPLAPFEAPAPNFIYVTDRLRHDYYDRWLHNPLRIDPESKMPRFDDDDGKTGVTSVLDGDAHKQFGALWNYMLLGSEMKPPTQ